MKLITLLIVICFSVKFNESNAQSDTITSGTYFKIAPLHAINFIQRPMIQVGFEHIFNSYWAIQAEYAIKYLDIHDADTSYTDSKGNSIRLEIKRFYANWANLEYNNYISCQLYYIKDNYTNRFEYYPDSISHADKITTNIKTDNFAVFKEIYGINLKIGLEKYITQRIIIDIYAGLGIRYRNIKNNYREYDIDKGHIPNCYECFDFDQDFETKRFSPDLSLGIKIGIKL